MGGGHAESLATKAASLNLHFETVLSRYDQEREKGNDWLAQATAHMAINGVMRVRRKRSVPPLDTAA
jgi:hypothetical protein